MSAIAEARLANTPAAWSESASLEESWAACGWSRESQLSRFAVALDALKPRAGEVLLDYGCGTGAFSEFMPADVVYVGYDSAPGMIARARTDHPGATFREQEPHGFVDLVAALGPFNLPEGWSKEHTWHSIRYLFEKAKRALVVSLYAGEDERCLIYTELEVERRVGGETFYSSVERWRHNDILLVLSREAL